MKKLLSIIALLVLTSSIFASSVLTPKGKQVSIKLSENTKIVTPNSPSKEMKKASEGLVKYIDQIFGVLLNVVEEKDYVSGQYISLGNTNLLKNSKLSQKGITKDGYSLGSKGNNLYIYGYDDYGVLNGVYCLLEEDLGCRWWDRYGNSTIPSIKTKTLKFVPRTFNPIYPDLREPYCSETGANWEYDLANRDIDNFIYGNKIKLWNWCWLCHTSFMCCDPENFKEHPDWFSMENGVRVPHQLCWSNPETIEQVEKKLKEVLTETDWAQISVSPQDGYPLCDCPKCNELDKKEGTKAATLVKALNQIIDDMQKIKPEFRLICLAYLDYVTPPKTIKPHKDLVLHLCSDSSDWYAPFATYDETHQYQNDLKAWEKWGNNVITWNYVADYDHYLIPYPNYEAVAKNIKILKDLNKNISGIMLQGNYGPDNDNGFRDDGFMKTWIWSKLLWNSNLNADKLKEEFIYGYYGKSAKYIAEYEKLIDNIYIENHDDMVTKLNPDNDKEQTYGTTPLLPVGRIRYNPSADMYTDDFVNKSKELLDKALDVAENDDIKLRVLDIRKSILYLILGRDLGYFDEFSKFHSKPFDDSKKDYYLDLLNELNSTLDKFNVTTVAETQPLKNNKEKYLNRWKEVLTRDLSKFDIKEITTNWQFVKDENNSLNPLENNDINWISMKPNVAWEDIIGEYDGYGWYKRVDNFTKEELEKKHIYMYFGGVDEDATVYFNGNLAIEHTCEKLGLTGAQIWDAAFLIDIKPFIKEGENTIIVKVFDREKAGGVYGNVKYIFTNEDVTESSIINLAE